MIYALHIKEEQQNGYLVRISYNSFHKKMGVRMAKKMFQKLLVICVGLLSQTSYSLEIKNIDYSLNEKKFEGVLLQQSEKAKKPLIIVIHNWMGISEETKTQGRRFAEFGYNVFLADIYGKNIRPKDAKEAGVLATQYKKDRKQFRENIKLAIETARC